MISTVFSCQLKNQKLIRIRKDREMRPEGAFTGNAQNRQCSVHGKRHFFWPVAYSQVFLFNLSCKKCPNVFRVKTSLTKGKPTPKALSKSEQSLYPFDVLVAMINFRPWNIPFQLR